MKQYFTEKNGNALKTPQSDVSRFVVPFAGTLQAIDYYSPNSAPGRGTNICQTRLNGVALFADVDRPEFFQSISKTGLSVAVVPGDVISTDLDQVGLIRPYLEICYHLDDGALIASSIHALTDVDDTGKTAGKVLEYNGTLWVPATPAAGASTLHALTDVNDTGKSTGQVLTYNGTAWVPVTPATGGAGFTYYEPDVPYGTPSTEDDEFAAGSLDAKWSAYNTPPAGTFVYPGSMGWLPTDGSNLRAIYQSVSFSGSPTYIAKFRAPSGDGKSLQFGFYTDYRSDIPNWRLAFLINSNSGGYDSSIYRWSTSSAVNDTHAGVSGIKPGAVIYAKLEFQYTDATHGKFLFSLSGDGQTWILGNDSSGATGWGDTTTGPTKIGLFVLGTDTNKMYVEWFRKLQGNYTGQAITI